jgi:hypothetical protein
MAEVLLGSGAPLARRKGCELMIAAVKRARRADVAHIRSMMAGPPSQFVPRSDLASTLEAWRRVQVRQLFRLSLEALLYWIMWQVEEGPLSTEALVGTFLDQVGRPRRSAARDWLNAARNSGDGPTELIARVSQAMEDASQTEMASAIADSLAFCVAEAPEHGQDFERADRLPLFRARREVDAWGKAPARNFVRHILESWVLAQHVYWSVGRGLADARARGKKTILRLKVILEEGGWTLTPGAFRAQPLPTRDRLETALSLAKECGLIEG